MNKLDCGIYRITHTPSGKTYIGQSQAMRVRWSGHKSAMKAAYAVSRTLRALWVADGPEAFAFDVLLVCGAAELDYYERAVILAYRPELNSSNNYRVANRRPKTLNASLTIRLPKPLYDAFRAITPNPARRLRLLLERDLRQRASRRHPTARAIA